MKIKERRQMDTRVTYERLFNIGNYDHEKFCVSKDITPRGKVEKELKNVVILICDLEEEVNKFRLYYREQVELLQRLNYCRIKEDLAEQKKIKVRLRKLDLIITAFKVEHQPIFKACKCYYCEHPDGDEEFQD